MSLQCWRLRTDLWTSLYSLHITLHCVQWFCKLHFKEPNCVNLFGVLYLQTWLCYIRLVWREHIRTWLEITQWRSVGYNSKKFTWHHNSTFTSQKNRNGATRKRCTCTICITVYQTTLECTKELFQFSHRYLFARTIRSTMSWESVVSLQIFWWQLLHI